VFKTAGVAARAWAPPIVIKGSKRETFAVRPSTAYGVAVARAAIHAARTRLRVVGPDDRIVGRPLPMDGMINDRIVTRSLPVHGSLHRRIILMRVSTGRIATREQQGCDRKHCEESRRRDALALAPSKIGEFYDVGHHDPPLMSVALGSRWCCQIRLLP
jgi:hypothetical protein